MVQFWARLEAKLQIERLHWREIRRNWPALAWLPKPAALPLVETPIAGSFAALVLRDNVRNRTRIERAYLKAIGEARSAIVLANAYFLPGARLRRALKHAVRRGVSRTGGGARTVRILYAVPRLPAGVERAGACRRRSVRIHPGISACQGGSGGYRFGATVGSSNLDPLSLLLAREANAVVHDVDFAQQLDTALCAVIQTSTRRWRSGGRRKTTLAPAGAGPSGFRIDAGFALLQWFPLLI